MDNSFKNQHLEDKYRKKVKAMAGFYKHLAVYLLVNISLLIMKLVSMKSDDVFFEWATFTTMISWGVGLGVHWVSVFKPTIIIAKDWEEEKIKKYMEREKNKKNQWE